MAIRKSVAAILQGVGAAAARGAKATAAPSASMTFTLTNFSGGAINAGTVRAKIAGYTGGGGLTSMAVRGTDGTNTVDLGQVAGSGVAASWVDVMEDFITDLNLTSITVVVTLAAAPTGGTQTADCEVWGASM
jgi:hypothetical protein